MAADNDQSATPPSARLENRYLVPMPPVRQSAGTAAWPGRVARGTLTVPANAPPLANTAVDFKHHFDLDAPLTRDQLDLPQPARRGLLVLLTAVACALAFVCMAGASYLILEARAQPERGAAAEPALEASQLVHLDDISFEDDEPAPPSVPAATFGEEEAAPARVMRRRPRRPRLRRRVDRQDPAPVAAAQASARPEVDEPDQESSADQADGVEEDESERDENSLAALMDETAADLDLPGAGAAQAPARTELSRADIKGVMAKATSAVRHCAEQHSGPERVTVRVSVEPSGRVRKSKLIGGTGGNFADCATAAIGQLTFPAWAGRPSTFSYPLWLQR